MTIYAYIVFGWYVFGIFILGLNHKELKLSPSTRFLSQCIGLAVAIPLIGRVVGWW